MRIRILTSVLTLLVCSVCARAQQQEDRLGRFEPGLIVETGARMGACDMVTFTQDGRFLLAVGDDKVVRVWRYTDVAGLDPHPLQVLRWSIFREQRGNIYALALSPDKEQRLVAVGGLGVRSAGGGLALIDRFTGEVKRAMTDPQATYHAIWSVAFSPSGNRVAFGLGDGQVNVWELKAPAKKDVLHVGKHTRTDKGPSNKVRLVAFPTEDTLLSVAEDGQLLQWNLADPKAAPTLVHRFGGTHFWQARLSSDRRWLGVVSQQDADKIEVLSLATRQAQKVKPAGTAWPNSLAFDARGERMAVSLWVKTGDAAQPARAQVMIHDLRQPGLPATPGPRQDYYVDAMAFHPDGKHLAIAGGADHEVTLWDLAKPGAGPRSTIVSPGHCLWGVALAHDERYLAFQEQVNVDPKSANQRGKGPWRIFDLHKRNWAPPAVRLNDIRPVLPQESADGWRIAYGTDAYTWYVLSPRAQAPPPGVPVLKANNVDTWHLPLDQTHEAYPRCFTFLRKEDGRRFRAAVVRIGGALADAILPIERPKPTRLAVGHFWGASVFELSEKEGPKRTRLMVGQQGEVMALTASADQKLLVTASRDQTIAAWNLTDWPSHSELGARFLLRQGKITVDEVDPGSPAWEANLSKGDEVLVLAFGRDELYDPGNVEPKERRANAKTIINAEQCMARLRNPVPTREFFFQLKRAGRDKPFATLTRVLQRPLWRFFPTRDGEWVLWRWRDYYYDCSTNGDQYIGWQVSGDTDVTPAFYKAEQFRKQFHRPDKVEAMIAGLATPEKVALPDIEPPEVRLEVAAGKVNNQDLVVSLAAQARGTRENHKLDRINLWVNDYLFQQIKVDGAAFNRKVVIPRNRLRRGTNLLTLQCYNRADIRGEAPPVRVEFDRPEEPPKLFGLFAGVGNYRKAARELANLNADKDAQALYDAWKTQKQKRFPEIDLQLFIDEEAQPAAVLKHLEGLTRQVRPDDLLVLFLGGHGTSDTELDRLARVLKKPAISALPPRSFAFAGPLFDPLRPNDTCLTSKDLYEAVARLPCRKLVLLDACHSGTLTVNPIRELTRDGVGPVMVTACQPSEQAIEYGLLDNNRAYGLFTMAVRRALEEEFNAADTDHNRELSAAELVAFVRTRVPKLVTELREIGVKLSPEDSQQPAAFLPELEAQVPVARK